ncbi:MAG: hypothetical protein OHK0017_09500 [Patescibacteria group bacterium]
MFRDVENTHNFAYAEVSVSMASFEEVYFKINVQMQKMYELVNPLTKNLILVSALVNSNKNEKWPHNIIFSLPEVFYSKWYHLNSQIQQLNIENKTIETHNLRERIEDELSSLIILITHFIKFIVTIFNPLIEQLNDACQNTKYKDAYRDIINAFTELISLIRNLKNYIELI